MSSKIYVGHFASDARVQDLELLNLKSGYGFVEFQSARAAKDAVYDFHGKSLLSERLIVELANGGRSSVDRRDNLLLSCLKSNHSGLPFTLQRRQLPVRPAFAMTIHKSQGQTSNHVGVYLNEPVFTHGQRITLRLISFYLSIVIALPGDLSVAVLLLVVNHHHHIIISPPPDVADLDHHPATSVLLIAVRPESL